VFDGRIGICWVYILQCGLTTVHSVLKLAGGWRGEKAQWFDEGLDNEHKKALDWMTQPPLRGRGGKDNYKGICIIGWSKVRVELNVNLEK
jgi:hypothetical protein